MCTVVETLKKSVLISILMQQVTESFGFALVSAASVFVLSAKCHLFQ